MPVKHRKLGARKGNDALAAVRDEMKETLAVIEEAAFTKGTEARRQRDRRALPGRERAQANPYQQAQNHLFDLTADQRHGGAWSRTRQPHAGYGRARCLRDRHRRF